MHAVERHLASVWHFSEDEVNSFLHASNSRVVYDGASYDVKLILECRRACHRERPSGCCLYLRLAPRGKRAKESNASQPRKHFRTTAVLCRAFVSALANLSGHKCV